jgi:hypothetical protein
MRMDERTGIRRPSQDMYPASGRTRDSTPEFHHRRWKGGRRMVGISAGVMQPRILHVQTET